MATDHSILPFPADIDREAFAHWLTGFVDGEGCFYLGVHPRRARRTSVVALFAICLRADDRPALQLIHSFFGCGHVEDKKSQRDGWGSQVRFRVGDIQSLADVIAPHFKRYPLRAKKARDFAIWREGVLLFREVAGRKRGPAPRWEEAELARFAHLAAQLRHSRKIT